MGIYPFCCISEPREVGHFVSVNDSQVQQGFVFAADVQIRPWNLYLFNVTLGMSAGCVGSLGPSFPPVISCHIGGISNNRASQAGVCVCVWQMWPSCYIVSVKSRRRPNKVEDGFWGFTLSWSSCFFCFIFIKEGVGWGVGNEELCKKTLYIETQARQICPALVTNQNIHHNIYFPMDYGGLVWNASKKVKLPSPKIAKEDGE